ncbi:MAG: hypothetical protein R8G66_21065 [Cytophagales bacterium]|nr:hypothetical protein [Cytophagales bacterium]
MLKTFKSLLILLIFLGLLSCEKFFELEDPYEEVIADEVLSIKPANDGDTLAMVADGLDFRMFKVTLGDRAEPDQTVMLSTNLGVLTQVPTTDTSAATTELELLIKSREAEFIYTAPLDFDRDILISAELQEIVQTVAIGVQAAFPDSLYLTASSFESNVSQDVTVTCNFLRSVGTTSNGLEVIFEQLSPPVSDDTVKVNFAPIALSNEGKASVILDNINDSTGVVTLRASHASEGLLLADTVSIVFTK